MRSFGFHKKQFNRYWWWYVFNSWLFDKKNLIITGPNNIHLRKVNVTPYGFNKIYTDKQLIEDKLYQTIDQFDEKEDNIVLYIV